MALGNYGLKNKEAAIKFAKTGQSKTINKGLKNYFTTLITNMEAGKDVFK